MPRPWNSPYVGPRNVKSTSAMWSPGRTPMPQKSRVMIVGLPPPPPHFSGTSVGSPVVPDVDMTAVSSLGGSAHKPPYGSLRSSRKRRSASLLTNGAPARKSARLVMSRGWTPAASHVSRMSGACSYAYGSISQEQLLLEREQLRTRHRLVLGVVVLAVDRRQVHGCFTVAGPGRAGRTATRARARLPDRSGRRAASARRAPT